MKIKGVNLGNWLVLEKWMNPHLFDGTTAEDEYYLPRQLSPEVYRARIQIHRSEYITERDFVTIASWGMNTVRIPVPYFVFGEREPFIGCVEELDHAFNWAEKYGLKILLDLHTAPDSQNGFDNGGICGVCKWAKEPDEVEFELSVIERLAERYGKRPGLWGIEPLNEPVTPEIYKVFNVEKRYPPVEPEMAKDNAPVSWDFLYDFYREAYRRIRRHAAEDKIVLFHDGFDIHRWKEFFADPQLKQVALDTHQYLMTAEMCGCPQTTEGYLDYIRNHYAKDMEEVQQYVDVLCGEWCLFNSLATGTDTHGGQSVLNGDEIGSGSSEAFTPEQKKEIYLPIAEAQLEAWGKGSGYFYWNYKLLIDTVNRAGWIGWDSWDLGRCIDFGWFPIKK